MKNVKLLVTLLCAISLNGCLEKSTSSGEEVSFNTNSNRSVSTNSSTIVTNPTPTPTPTPTTTACTNLNKNGSKFVPRSLWAWRGSKDFINNFTVGGERDRFFAFAESRNVRTVYVNVRTMLEKYGTTTPETNTETNLKTFLDQAAKKCISVHLLVGNNPAETSDFLSDAESVNDSKTDLNTYPTMRKYALNAKKYIQSLTGAKPTSLHFDIEPDAFPTNWTGHEARQLQRLVNAFQVVRGILDYKTTKIMLSADLGDYFENAAFAGIKCDPLNNLSNPTYTLLASECLIKVIDQVVLMDYNDSADITIPKAISEITFASNSLNKNFNGNTTAIIIGQETMQLAANVSNRTFYEELISTSSGIKAMETQLQIIQNKYDVIATSAYGGRGLQKTYNATNPLLSAYDYPASDVTGIAVHYYEVYSEPFIYDNFK